MAQMELKTSPERIMAAKKAVNDLMLKAVEAEDSSLRIALLQIEAIDFLTFRPMDMASLYIFNGPPPKEEPKLRPV